jgi:hypothetical protein
MSLKINIIIIYLLKFFTRIYINRINNYKFKMNRLETISLIIKRLAIIVVMFIILARAGLLCIGRLNNELFLQI